MEQYLELYVHLPFCVRKCDYCDFLSFPAGEQTVHTYMDALTAEVRAAAVRDAGYRVSSIFLGGGTPSIVPAEAIEALLREIYSCYTVVPEAEISMEVNPGTATAEKLRIWKRAGINRISIGCQSTEDAELLALGRIHTFAQFRECYQLAREAGFSNINVDLMSALPGQSVASWERSLRIIAELAPEHISAYSLIIEPGTPFYERYHAQTSALPDEESERMMYERTETILAGYGFHRYEISNYAREGRECRHNVGYWTGVPYRGLGLGASSYLEERRFQNPTELDTYVAGQNAGHGFCTEVENLTVEDRMAEFMILGLRLTRGCSVETFAERFGCSFFERYGAVFEKYQKLGLLEQDGAYIRLTRRGISVSNTVMADFL